MTDISRLQGKHGTVQLRDHYWTGEDGTQFAGITGVITVVGAEEALGFEVNNRDSNWVAHIEGPEDEVVIPGCMVMGFHLHGATETTPYYYRVA